MISTLTLDDPLVKSLFESMFQKRNLIPVLGAGFSKGAPTTHANVPDAGSFSDVMLACLRKHAGEDASALAGKTFSELAEYFLNPEFVPIGLAKEVIRSYFIGVKLDSERRAFLACSWPYFIR